MALGTLSFVMDQYGWKNLPTILGENLPNGISGWSVENFMGYIKSQFVALCKSGRHAVAQLAEALCYNPEGREFDSRRGHWIFRFT
jgi:hypothetical protein